MLGDTLKLLHPFMPFVTEKIYMELYNNDESIMIAKYPEYNEKLDFKVEEDQIEQIKEIITGIRNIRTKMNVHPSKKSKLIFIVKPEDIEFIQKSEGFIKKLGFSEEKEKTKEMKQEEIKTEKQDIPQNAVNVVTPRIEVFIPFEDLVNIEEEKQRLEKEKSKILIEKEKTDKMLGNPGFLAKAPEAKVQEEKAKLEKFNEMIANIESRIKNLK